MNCERKENTIWSSEFFKEWHSTKDMSKTSITVQKWISKSKTDITKFYHVCLDSILQVISLVNHSRVTLKDEPKTLNQDEDIQGN